MYKIDYLPSYSDDLDAVLFYLEADQKSPRAADTLLEALDTAVQGLTEFPRRYRKYHPKYPLETEYRLMFVKGNAVFYTIDEKERAVKIHRILNSHCDFDQWL